MIYLGCLKFKLVTENEPEQKLKFYHSDNQEISGLLFL